MHVCARCFPRAIRDHPIQRSVVLLSAYMPLPLFRVGVVQLRAYNKTVMGDDGLERPTDINEAVDILGESLLLAVENKYVPPRTSAQREEYMLYMSYQYQVVRTVAFPAFSRKVVPIRLASVWQ